MKIVIQCASSKKDGAGYMKTKNGKRVMFVAQPQFAPQSDDVVYHTPDSQSDWQESWRTRLEKYNKSPGNNPLNLYPAYKLYKNEIYRKLANRFGVEHMYILSAGWGMIRADFLTPQYNITFSPRAEYYKRRKFLKTDPYFNMLPDDGDSPIVFFGGKDYISLFCSLTAEFHSRRIVYYSSAIRPGAPGCEMKRFDPKSKRRTNWHYECAEAFPDSSTEISF
jgi:hypothetical protein